MTVVMCRRCLHTWNYRGKSKWYATCPRCRVNVKLSASVIDKLIGGGYG